VAAVDRLILDSGAVIAASRGEARSISHIGSARRRRVDVSVPAVVLAETLRGRRDDAPVHRVVNAVGRVTETIEEDGRLAGRLLGDHDMSATIDALIVASTVRLGGGVILTGDAGDLTRLASGFDEIHVEPI